MQSDIQHLRSLWDQAKQSWEQKNQWLQERESLMEEILLIERSIPRHEQQAKEKQNLLKKLVLQKQNLDHQLDEIEELSEETIQDLKTQLTTLIAASYSQKDESYKKLLEQIGYNQSLAKDLAQAEKIFQQLTDLLRGAVLTRKEIGGTGWLAYIFGTSPNDVISKYLNDSSLVAKSALPILKRLAEHPHADTLLKKVYDEAIQFLVDVEAHCKKQWGFRHVDTVITEDFNRSNTFADVFQRGHQAVKETLRILEKEMEEWIIEEYTERDSKVDSG